MSTCSFLSYLVSSRCSSDRWDIGIVAEYIFRIIVRFQFAQATIVFWTVCRAHALSLVSRKEIGVRAAGGIGASASRNCLAQAT